ncbi:hypothetical protein A1D23_12825 [Chelonobacter oris]|uniref:amidohydrolase family protein n=1 Tax=Chelonobacter oris TaxID=505317 RepID=UPI00244B7CC0|nr:amidohydrolase family protein [Chelonobacter oris]MDH3001426.1 hypothetical protein [Chelonobacter oris]
MNLIIENATFYSIGTGTIETSKFIYIENGIIKAIGNMESYEQFLSKNQYNSKKYNAKELIILPGLINSHIHPSKELYQGINDYNDITNVLSTVHKNNNIETEYAQEVSSLYSILKQIKSGVTTIGVFTSRPTIDYRAIKESKIRANINYCQNNQWIGLGNKPKTKSIDAIIESYFYLAKSLSSNLVSFSPATASELSANKDLILEFYNILKSNNIKFYLHIHEGKNQVKEFIKHYSCTAIKYLKKLNILDENLTLIHSSFLYPEDIKILEHSDCNLIHCPVSNSYVGASTMPISHLKNKIIGLGTDAAMVNPLNNLLFDSLFCLYHHGTDNLSEKLSSKYILEMITTSGAKTLNIRNTGEIKVENYADMLFIEKDKLDKISPLSILTNLHSRKPKNVMINGEFIIKDNKFTQINFNEIENNFLTIKQKIKGD